MKNLKTLLSTLAIAAVFSAGAFAQSGVDANVDVDASVIADISIDQTVGLNFGNVFDGSSPTFDPNDSNNDQDLGQNATLGLVELTAEPGVDLSIDFETDAVTSDNIEWTPDVAGHTANERGNSTDLDGNPETTGYTTEGTSGKYFIFVGGSLDLTGASAGNTFDETFTININYF